MLTLEGVDKDKVKAQESRLLELARAGGSKTDRVYKRIHGT